MARDVRQVVAGLLTGSMLIMLCNMVKRDHFDPIYVENLSVQYDLIKVSKQSLVKLSDRKSGGIWRENFSLKPCWRKPLLTTNEEKAKGNIFFTLTDNPEDHITQIADAVVVAKYLGATLVLPEIRGTKTGHKRQFGDIYDTKRFITSLDGTVEVAKDPPMKASASKVNITNIKIPFMVTKDFIESKIQPIFKAKRNLILSTDLSPSTMTKAKETIKKDNVKMDPYACLAIFGSLEVQQELNQLVSSMIVTLRSLSYKTNGQFVAVDLKVESLGNLCKGNVIKTKNCFDPKEIGEFLKKIGYQRHTTIYLTQSGWHSSLDDFRKIFPNTFTKDAIIPAYEKAKYHITKSSEFEKVIDFQICTQADVFVPTISNLFYANVVAKRIASGKTEVLDPTQKASASSAAGNYVSPYISKKSHWAYSCFC